MKHEPSLDGLRALAAIAVVLFHVSFPFSRGGIRGVDIFFVLSGYLITTILAGGEQRTYRKFWAGRVRRLMPALVFFLVAYVVAAPYISPEHAGTRWIDASFALFYLADQAQAFGAMHGLAHTWSLAVEGWFYILWPFVVRRLRRLSPTRASTILLVAWAVVTCARSIVYLQYGWRLAYSPSELHCSGLLLGAAVAFRPWSVRFGVLGGILLCALYFVQRTPDATGPILWSIPLAEIGAAAVICSLTHDTLPRRILSWKPLTRLGLLSYGIYLWHYPIAGALSHQLWWFKGPAVLLAATCLSAVSYTTVEAFFRRRQGQSSVKSSPTIAVVGVEPQPPTILAAAVPSEN